MNGVSFYLILGFLLFSNSLFSQTYTVNSSDDTDDGVCNAAHCSLREAINAANADLVPSRIEFNLLKAGPDTIFPTSRMPNITDNSLIIFGESQPGPDGDLVIDFRYQDFLGNPFLTIIGTDVSISGITFSQFRYVQIGDEVIRVGTLGSAADNFTIYNCAFPVDNLTGPNFDKPNVHIFNSANAIVRKNIFGSDYGKTVINTYFGGLFINMQQALKPCLVDSNIFVTSRTAMAARGGDLIITKNIFGALDTSKSNTFTSQESGIIFDLDGKYLVNDNFFIFHVQNAISNRNVGIQDNIIDITKNRFYNFNRAISLGASQRVVNNFAANTNMGFSGTFLEVSSPPFFNITVDVESNQTENLQNFYNIIGAQNLVRSSHSKNRIICNENNPVIIGNFVDAVKPPVPLIVRVNRGFIEGTARPNDSVSVYENTRRNCPTADCRGGVEIGRALADATGNWSLARNFTAGASLSAYVWNNNNTPLVYSEFSPCYRCTANAPVPVTATICEGQTFTFRSRVYNAANTKDTITFRGDGVSICDTVFHIDVTVIKPTRETQNVNVCFGDTLRVAGITLYEGKLLDSVKLSSANNCDSTIIFIGTVRGYNNINQTLCSNSSITIGNTVFDRNNTSGRVRLSGQAVGGCDSIIDVNITIKDFAENFINLTLCPGEDTLINGKLYNNGNLSGIDTLKGASATGCDSVLHISLRYPNTTGSYRVTICRSDSVFIVKEYFSDRNPSGQIICKAGEACASVFGCDSIINVDLDFIPDAMGFYRADICRGDTITLPGFPGEKFFSGRTNGTLKMVNSAANGCDSLIQVNLKVLDDAIGSFDTVLCDNQTLDLYGNIFDKNRPSANIRVKDLAVAGCDSFIMVRIQFNSETVGQFDPLICRKDSILVGNMYFSASRPSGSVRLPGASSAGCDSVVNVNVNIVPDILVNFRTADLLCNEANTGELIIDNISGGSGNLMLSVDNGTLIAYQAGMIIPNLSQGNHILRIVDQKGCDASSTFTINNSNVLSLMLPRDTTIKKGSSVDITARINFNPSNITWAPTDFLNCTNCLNPVSTPENTITYTLTLKDENGCEIRDTITITVIVDQADVYFPNVFSPNGDEINDNFFPVFKFPNKTRINYFQIYDRWGELIFDRIGGIPGEIFEWDGMYKDKKLLPGVYVYTIQFVGEDNVPKNRKGEVTLLR